VNIGGNPVEPRAVLSDISVFRDLLVEVKSGIILLQSRSRSNVLAEDGNADTRDKGLDYFAGRNLVFLGKEFQVETKKDLKSDDVTDEAYSTSLMSPRRRDVQFGVQSGKVEGSFGLSAYPYHLRSGSLNTGQFYFQLGAAQSQPRAVPLDMTALGASSLRRSIGAANPEDDAPEPTTEENFSQATLEALKQMGIYARNVSPVERAQKLDNGFARFDELPAKWPAAAEDMPVVVARLPFALTSRIAQEYNHLFDGKELADASEAAAQGSGNDITARRARFATALLEAQKDFQREMGDDSLNPLAFRAFLEADAQYAKVRGPLDKMRRIWDAIPGLGITDARRKDVGSKLLKPVNDPGAPLELEDLKLATFAAPAEYREFSAQIAAHRQKAKSSAPAPATNSATDPATAPAAAPTTEPTDDSGPAQAAAAVQAAQAGE
jgi:hypothetical protein